MRTDEIVFIAVMLAVFGSVAALLSAYARHRHRQRTQRLDILQTALQRPDLDAATRREIMRVLTEEHAARGVLGMLLKPALWLRLWFAVGWLMFFVGGGFWVLDLVGVLRDVPHDVVAPMALGGLAMMTLPLGLHELMRRDRRVADAR